MSLHLIEVQELATSLCPDIEHIIAHRSEATASTWEKSIGTGKAIEFLTLCSIISSLRKYGAAPKIPELFFENPDLYYLRNVLPRHHGAQAGHEAALRSIQLKDRFIASLTPKAEFIIKGVAYGLYREGFPVHQIEILRSVRNDYQDRPDIMVVEGALETVMNNDSELEFNYCSSMGSCNGILRIKNDPSIPLIRYDSSLNGAVEIAAIVECSIGKSGERADEQIRRYVNLFNGSSKHICTMLVNGRKVRIGGFDIETHIDLSRDVNALRATLVQSTDDLVSYLFQGY
jgi:hypothetical protein